MSTATTQKGVKKLVVRTLKKNDALSADDVLERQWPLLQDFVDAVHEARLTNHSFQELYGAVESLVLARQGAAVYERLSNACRSHVAKLVSGLVGLTQDPMAVLTTMQSTWSAHCTQMIMIRNVFLYLDRTYVRDTAGVRQLWDLGLHLFRERLVSFHTDVTERIVGALVACVAAERSGEAVDRPALSAVTRMLGALRLYSSHLEPALLASADAAYSVEGRASVAAMDVPGFLRHAEARLQQERERAAAYLDPVTASTATSELGGGGAGTSSGSSASSAAAATSTGRKLVAVVDARLLAQHASALLERGFAGLVEAALAAGVGAGASGAGASFGASAQRCDDLRRMYALLGRVAGQHEEMRRCFADLAKRRAAVLVAEESDEKDRGLVQALLDLRDGLDALVAAAFAHNEGFTAAIKSALELAVNSRENKPAELIAKYVDARMRGGAKASGLGGDDEMESLIDRVMALFRCIHGKDVFEAFYKKDLAKRLLLSKSASSDLEKVMVGKLKTECGSQFTAKLEGMFKDADLSRDLMAQFACGKAAAELGVELFVHVLTSSYWPAYVPGPALVPAPLAACLEAYDAFYNNKFSKGRRLLWQHQLGHCVVKATFPSGKKELEVSFFQSLVLLLFNSHDELDFLAIKAATGVEDGELRRTLQSLALGKARVLRKEPKGKEVADADRFAFNAEFRDPLIRIKINTIQMRETKQEVDATHEKVVEDRQYQVDAAIVRIMKTRKSLPHAQLMTEIFAQLRFPAKAIDVKKRVESLIERDYLERDEGDANTYNYLA